MHEGRKEAIYGLVREVIRCFALFNFALVAISQLPVGGPINLAKRWTHGYLRYVGLSQGWRLFAPNPTKENIAIEARVTLLNGNTITWNPSIPLLSGRYANWRFRKWLSKLGATSAPKAVVAASASYMARQAACATSQPATNVTLVRLTTPIAARHHEEKPPPTGLTTIQSANLNNITCP